jgi:hypothetical protein
MVEVEVKLQKQKEGYLRPVMLKSVGGLVVVGGGVVVVVWWWRLEMWM